ncbi:MAG: hypothetical protein J2P41_11460, partial [Blastocatellia bacterium]|nr:hypothetical protein [Blastocatellia bacterium]
AAKAMAEYRIEHPEALAPLLAEGLHEVRALRGGLGNLSAVARANVDGLLARKERDFSDALIKAHGVVVDALSNAEIVTEGEKIDVTVNVYLRGASGGDEFSRVAQPKCSLLLPQGWDVTNLPAGEDEAAGPLAILRGRDNAGFSARFRATVPEGASVTQPYWLAKQRGRDQYDWDETMPRNLPFTPAIARARVELELSGERVAIEQPVEYRFADKTFGEIRRELKVAPVLTLTVNPQLLVIPADSRDRAREVSVEVTNNARRAVKGEVRLIAPPGWKVEADERPLDFARQLERTSRQFRVTPAAGANGSFDLSAVARADGHEFTNGYTAVAYPHIETHFIYRPARVKAEVFDVKVARGLKVGYLLGSGDSGPEALAQLGVDVRVIGPAELASGDLSVYDTIVLGIRIYEVNEGVRENNKRLLEYVANGGTLIVQYNKEEFERGYAPYPIKMLRGGERVTNEDAPITVLAPEHQLFNYPNKIGEEDWQGWVQERGLYFLHEWDSHFSALLAAPDENGALLKGGELIAQYGKGVYLFTGYAWFRQFPAGVPGAYRLFANMVSLPKKN